MNRHLKCLIRNINRSARDSAVQFYRDEMQKLVVALLLAVGAVLLAGPAVGGRWPDSCGSQKEHTFTFGQIRGGDRILASTYVNVPKKMLRVQSFDRQFATPGTISYIQVMDQKKDGKGGCVYLSDGGFGFNRVTLHFKSDRGEGMNFLVNIYGR